MNSTQIAIRFILTKYLMLCIILLVLAPNNITAQEYNALSFIDSFTNIIDQQETYSKDQLATESSLYNQAVFVLKNNYKNLNEDEVVLLRSTISSLRLKKKNYEAIVYKNEISDEVFVLEKKLQRFKDSIAHIQQQLIATIEVPLNTVYTKDKAIHVLASIHNEETLQYLLENEINLRFGTSDYIDTGDWEEDDTRSAMIAILNEYFYKPEVNWMVFPFILKYVNTVGLSEISLFRELYGYPHDDYQDSWYLLKFIQSNVSPPIKTLIESMLRSVEIPEEKK